jgi:RNA polymerase sigma-70 factor (ECF subfamily)
MGTRASRKISRELTFLAALDHAGAPIDTSKIAEVQDWSGAIVGGFYGAFIDKTSRTRKLLSSLTRGFRHSVAGLDLNLEVAGERTEPSQPKGIFAVPARIEQEVGNAMPSSGTINYVQMANPQLVAECLKTTEGSWTEFVHRTQPIIYRTVVKATHRAGSVSREAIDDLVQDVYLKLCANDFRALRKFETLHENALFGFLKVVASNVVRDHFRQLTAQRGADSHRALAMGPTDRPGTGRSSTEQGLLLSAIDKALKTLSQQPDFERDRTVFWLYYRKELTAKEISSLPGIGLTQKGVESVLLRQTRLIRAAFQNSPTVDLTNLPEKRG